MQIRQVLNTMQIISEYVLCAVKYNIEFCMNHEGKGIIYNDTAATFVRCS